MKRPLGVALGIAVGSIALAGLVVCARESRAQTWQVPLTPWGHPDFQGIWTTDAEIGIPVERPVQYGEKALLTDQEFEERVVPKGTALGFVGGSFTDGPFDGPEDLNLFDRCITRGLPTTWYPSQYSNGFQIVQSQDYVALLYERLHEARIIPLDGRPHLDPSARWWLGDSRGRWEGKTLVVDVTNFSDQATFMKSGSTLHLIERYTRVDPDTLTVSVTIDDPTTW